MAKRRYICVDCLRGARRGCMVLEHPEDTALLTLKGRLWVKYWALSDIERIIVVKPLGTLGFTVEVWERRWDWGVGKPTYVRLVWKASFHGDTIYPLCLRAHRWEDGEAKKALEEIVLRPMVLFEELKAVLQQHARLFIP